jgi:hypothetical protein
VAGNNDDDRRTGTLSVGGRTLRIEQEGARRERPENVEVEGRVQDLRGSCPSLSFSVRGQTVVTDGDTRFEDGSCRSMREGRRVQVRGERRGSGPIRARRIEMDDDDDNDDN